MAQTSTASGIVINAPDTVSVSSRLPARARRGARPAVIPEVFADAGFTVLDTLNVDAKRPTAKRRGAQARGPSKLSIDVPRSAKTKSLLLIESHGIYQWVGPNQQTPTVRRGGVADTFTVGVVPKLPASGLPPVPKRRDMLSRIKGQIYEKATIYVLRYPARALIRTLVARIDGAGPFGLMEIKGADPAKWVLSKKTAPRPISGKKRRVLLFVHGTFSTTRGSFGSLARKNARIFFDKLDRSYDAVLGFEHKTLGEGVAKNARDLRKALEGIEIDGSFVLDAVGYSRGGLVLRYFIEHEFTKLPKWQRGRIVFVGSTLNGTELACRQNWYDLISNYSNLLAGAAQTVGVIVGAGVVTNPLEAVVRVLGGFAKVVVDEGVKETTVPGLASMTPGSPLIESLHNQPHPELSDYYAITSAFEPVSKQGSNPIGGLKLVVADRVADRLFSAANDLVVNTRSMTRLDDAVAIRSRVMNFGEADGVYHTVYFAQRRTAQTLARWLLDARDTQAPRRQTGRSSEDHLLLANIASVVPDTASGARRAYGRKVSDRPPRTDGSANASGSSKKAGVYKRESGGKTPRPTSKRKLENLVPCYFKATVPQTIPLEQHARLLVTISRDEMESSQTATEQAGSAVADRRTPIMVSVVPLSCVSVVGVDRRQVQIPPEGQSTTCNFDILGDQQGVGRLLVQFEQAGTLMATLELSPFIVTMENQHTAAIHAELQPTGDARNHITLQIYEMRDGNRTKLRVSASCPNPAINFTDVVEPANGIDLDELIRARLDLIQNAPLGTKRNYRMLMDQIESHGQTMLEALLPESIRKALTQHWEVISAILVISEQSVIPWELLNVRGKGFLAEKGLLRWRSNLAWGPTKLDLDPKRARFICPNYKNASNRLSGAREEVGKLLQTFKGSRELACSYDDFMNFIQDPGDLSVLHIACHGDAVTSPDLCAHLMLSDTDTITDTVVRTNLNFNGRPRPLVFLNACQVGQTGRSLAGIGGFAEAFLAPSTKSGAGAFIAPLWSVGDITAFKFAQKFYDALLGGQTLVRAVTQARQAAIDQEDPTWLSYSIYGNPSASKA